MLFRSLSFARACLTWVWAAVVALMVTDMAPLTLLMLMVLMLSSLLGLYYLLEVPVKAFFFKPLEDAHHREGIHEAPTASLIAIIITAIMTVGLFVRPDLAFNLMAMVIPGGVQ